MNHVYECIITYHTIYLGMSTNVNGNMSIDEKLAGNNGYKGMNVLSICYKYMICNVCVFIYTNEQKIIYTCIWCKYFQI
jgi:hypothetical protein